MKKVIILMLATLLISTHLISQKDGEDIVIGKYRRLYSEKLGENRLLMIKLPVHYNKANKSYPVLYLLYADYMEQYFADTVSIVHKLSQSGKIPQMIIVGVGNTMRYRDLLPVDRRGSSKDSERFFSFFSDEVIPFISKEYRSNNYRILVGPQAGSAFGLNAVINKTEMFDAYLVNTPFFSFSSNNHLLTEAKKILRKPQILRKFFFITYQTRNIPEFKIKAMRAFKEILPDKMLKKSEWTFNELKNNSDFIPPLGLKKGLNLLFEDYRFPPDMAVNRIGELEKYYSKASEKYGFRIDIPARVILLAGDQLNRKKDKTRAVEFYKYLTRKYPENLNGYFRLAEIAEQKGDYGTALINVKRLLELAPGNGHFKSILKRLQSSIKK